MKQKIDYLIVKYPFISLIFIASIVYLLTFAGLDLWHFIVEPDSDAWTYEEAVDLLYKQHFTAHPTRPMGFPLLLGLPKLFTDNEIIYRVYFRITALGLWLSTGFLLYKSLKFIFNPHLSFFGATFFYVNVSNIIYNNIQYTETLYTFTLTLMLYFYVKYVFTKNWTNLVIAFATLSFSIIVRPSLSPLFFPFLAVLVYFLWKNKVNWQNWAFLAFAIYCTVGVQSWNMNRRFGEYKISYIGDAVSYLYFSTYVDAIDSVKSVAAAREVTQNLRTTRNHYVSASSNDNPDSTYRHGPNCPDCAVQAKYFQQYLFKTITQKPFWSLFTFCRGLISNSLYGNAYTYGMAKKYMPKNLSSFNLKIFFIISTPQNILYSFSALFLFPIILWKRYKTLKIWLPLFIVVWAIICLSTLSFGQADRFHIVFVPLTIFLLLNSLNFNFLNKNKIIK